MVNPSEVTSPSPITSFLSIDIDSHEGAARIDPMHLQAIIQELSSFHQGKSATKCEILSLIGKCILILFAGCALQAGPSCGR